MMQSCLVLQQTAVESPPFDIARNAAEHIRGLGQRLGAGDSSFDAVLDALLQAGLASWIVDYVAVVCADSSVTSDDPEEAFLLSGEAVAAWCCRSTEGLQRQLHALITGEQGPGAVAEEAEISRIAAGAESLLRVARGLRAAVAWSGSSRQELVVERVRLDQQTGELPCAVCTGVTALDLPCCALHRSSTGVMCSWACLRYVDLLLGLCQHHRTPPPYA